MNTAPTQPEHAEEIFNHVKNPENWKLPTIPQNCDADSFEMVRDAIIWYVGGAECRTNMKGDVIVTSKGYYHYIGA